MRPELGKMRRHFVAADSFCARKWNILDALLRMLEQGSDAEDEPICVTSPSYLSALLQAHGKVDKVVHPSQVECSFFKIRN